MFTPLREKPTKGYVWSGGRLTKIQTTARPDHVWPEVWTKIGKAAQNRETQESAQEKPKLDNARRLTSLIQTTKNIQKFSKITRRKMERPMAPAMPCKRQTSIAKANAKPKIGDEKESRTMYGCKVESHASTRQRAEFLQSKIHEDRIAGKGFISMTHCNLVHKFILMPQSMNIPNAKVAVDKGWNKLETTPAWILVKVKSILEAPRDKKKVNFATLMDICHLKQCGVGTKITEVQRQSRVPGGHCNRRPWSPRSLY